MSSEWSFSEADVRRFLKKVDRGRGACWIWTATPSGRYGLFWLNGRYVLAHRAAFYFFIGVPTHAEIDHLCFNKRCVNPAHLEAVSARENTIRARSLITQCPKGHLYDEANTAFRSTAHGGVQRVCKACDRESAARQRRQRIATAA